MDGFDRADLGDNGGIGNSTAAASAELVPGASNNPKVGRQTEWYSPASFVLQAPGTIGNLGRNRLFAPGFMDFDMSVDKETRLTERLGMQIRFEVSILSTVRNWASRSDTLQRSVLWRRYQLPGAGVPNPDAGIIHNTVFASRQMQLGAKFTF